MRTYDLTPLFRSSVGFDRWSNLFDAALRADTAIGKFLDESRETLNIPLCDRILSVGRGWITSASPSSSGRRRRPSSTPSKRSRCAT